MVVKVCPECSSELKKTHPKEIKLSTRTEIFYRRLSCTNCDYYESVHRKSRRSSVEVAAEKGKEVFIPKNFNIETFLSKQYGKNN